MTAKTFRIIGNILIVIVILACLPVAIPKLLGLQGYDVISGSMEPSISVGSIVYVKNVEFAELATGDVIAFETKLILFLSFVETVKFLFHTVTDPE